MAELYLARKGMALVATDEVSAGILAALPFGKDLKAEIRAPRNPGRHKLFFVLCHRIAAAIDVTPEALRDHLTVEAGYYYEVKTPSGIRRYPKSIAWSKMDETEFRDFFERCVRVIITDWGIKREDVMDAVADLLEPHGAENAR